MQTSQIDWFRILADLRNAGMNHCQIAKEINVPRTRLKEWWLNGRTPKFDDGALLVLLWLKKTQKTQGEQHFTVQSNTVAEQMATACLSVRCLALPRKGR